MLSAYTSQRPPKTAVQPMADMVADMIPEADRVASAAGKALALRERPAYGETLSSIEANQRIKKWVYSVMGLLIGQLLCLIVNCELIWDYKDQGFTPSWSVKPNWGAQICKTLFTVFTFAMVVFVYKIRMHDREEALMFGIELAEGGRKYIYLELFLLCLHVPPFLNVAFECQEGSSYCVEEWVDTMNLYCLCKAYLMLEYYKIHHTCWIQREALQEVLKNSDGDPVLINSSYVVRAGLLEEPWTLTSKGFVTLLLIFCYWIFIAERAVDRPDDLLPMGIHDTLYYILIVFTGVGLGELYCVTQIGRIVTVLISVIGVAFTAVSLSTLMSWVRMQEEEIAAASVADYLHTRQQVREEAAIMIQRWWRKVRDELDSGDLENRRKILSESNFGVKPGAASSHPFSAQPPPRLSAQKTGGSFRPRLASRARSNVPAVAEHGPLEPEAVPAEIANSVSELRDDVKRLEELMMLLISKVDGKSNESHLPAAVKQD